MITKTKSGDGKVHATIEAQRAELTDIFTGAADDNPWTIETVVNIIMCKSERFKDILSTTKETETKETESIIETHRKMVLRLKKPGDFILASLTSWDCDLIHMAGCLPGEAAELYDAIQTDPTTLTEELGDYAFYLVACRNLFDINNWTGLVGGSNARGNAIELMRLGGHFWDVVKRIVIYCKAIDVPDSKYDNQTLIKVAQNLLDQMEQRFNAILTYYGYTLEEILKANYEKLANVDTGRYSSGTYSDQQAQDRKDKA
jgi:hypothetical protein